MRRILQLIGVAVWFAAPSTVMADPIAITSGVITLPSRNALASMTLTGTDRTQMFTFAGNHAFSPNEDYIPAYCLPCVCRSTSRSSVGRLVRSPTATKVTKPITDSMNDRAIYPSSSKLRRFFSLHP